MLCISILEFGYHKGKRNSLNYSIIATDRYRCERAEAVGNRGELEPTDADNE